jgi:ribosomal protein L29
MARVDTFKEKTVEELRLAYAELSRDLFRIRSEFAVTREMEKTHRLTALRRDRARILTVLRQKGAKLS